ncbi:SH3 domain-containing protein [Mucilaginibacter sp. HME9299]|uniref:SH3 domain-containing protein n=2 Tax=Mucilaginibacter aquatilis TaxID=1517760 RepID=A0A6I4I3P5_9SPHI|nr:SH3 domain-containing protein [Mucilaginibacter aquatilis]
MKAYLKLNLLPLLLLCMAACTNNGKPNNETAQPLLDKADTAIAYPDVATGDTTVAAPVKADKLIDLFPEGVEINFTPDDVKSNDPKYSTFRQKLAQFENKHNVNDTLDAQELIGLVNNEVFSNTETFVNSKWLKYFLNRYKFNIADLSPVVDVAIKQEDYEAIKNILKHGFIVDTRQIELATEVKENASQLIKYNKQNKGLDEAGDPTFYESKYSRIDEIMQLLLASYNANSIYDSDGFTNLRQAKSSSSTIIQRIKTGSHIKVLDNTNNWFQVELPTGQKGYVHHSKIRSI